MTYESVWEIRGRFCTSLYSSLSACAFCCVPRTKMALVNDHVTDASEKKMGGQDAGSAAVARSNDSAHGHAKGGDLQFITKNNQLDSEFQLPVTADAKATWVSAASIVSECSVSITATNRGLQHTPLRWRRGCFRLLFCSSAQLRGSCMSVNVICGRLN